MGLSQLAAALNAGRVTHLVYDPNIRYTGNCGRRRGRYTAAKRSARRAPGILGLALLGRGLCLVGAEFTVRPTLRCDVKWPGVTLKLAPSGSPTLRPATLRGPQPVSSDRRLGWKSRT